ncbi:hypothetical protein LTR37_019916 [Vermiconidia calcicola]|uniref:Uncharacterized protein n=1 Tax=Vermiconidia calcicola TaxID=1690605 RepID=A0ACC3MCV3_9PEZI|nr:hypothetical protein LTR37_019916 [Vermiconidia calcicola]
MAVEANEGQQRCGALFFDTPAPAEDPQSCEASSFSSPGTPHLQRMPAQIRNHIYELLFGDDEIDITQPWPGITGTCQRIRTETLPIFLSHSLSASIINCDGTNLFLRLSSIQELSRELRALIPNLRVNCEGRLLERTERIGVTITDQNIPLWRYLPNFDCWNDIIQHITGSGLLHKQVEWPGANPLRLSRIRPDLYIPDPDTQTVALEKYIFNKHLLTPLLKMYNFFDSDRPPIDVSRQFQGDDVTKERSAKECEKTAARVSPGHPPDFFHLTVWYEGWELEREEAILERRKQNSIKWRVD